jgi:hypothetical protein
MPIGVAGTSPATTASCYSKWPITDVDCPIARFFADAELSLATKARTEHVDGKAVSGLSAFV